MISTIGGLTLLGLAQAQAPVPVPPPPPPVRLMPAPPAPPPPPPPPYGRSEPARARANLGSLISSDDYPAVALRNEEEGVVGFRLLVGTNGRVTNCIVTSSSGSPSLDAATCRILTSRARFTPARDSLGELTTDTVSARVIWRIEESDISPVVPTLFVDTMRATPDGQVTCTYHVDDNPPETYDCPAEDSARLAASALTKRAAAVETIVTTWKPAGQSEPAIRANHGRLVRQTEAVLTIAPDGSVQACRVVRPGAPSPCEDYAPGPTLVFEPAKEAVPRALTIRNRYYSRP